MLTKPYPAFPHARSFSQRTEAGYITIITDEIELAETLQLLLNQADYRVNVIYDGLRGIRAIQQIKPSLAIVSWTPPGLTGLEICTRIKSSQNPVPVILLAPTNQAKDRIAGLYAGASDCISRPFIKEELLARIQANLVFPDRNSERATILRCADLQLDRKTREVFRGVGLVSLGKPSHIQLTAKEFDLLDYMISHSHQVLARKQIVENVWGYTYLGNSNVVEVYIRYLRVKLESDRFQRLIHTVRGVGYILREPAQTKC
ncbi:MAG: response regulator transcription factor [Cyanobacteria bacterium P01_H01_bin.26]